MKQNKNKPNPKDKSRNSKIKAQGNTEVGASGGNKTAQDTPQLSSIKNLKRETNK